MIGERFSPLIIRYEILKSLSSYLLSKITLDTDFPIRYLKAYKGKEFRMQTQKELDYDPKQGWESTHCPVCGMSIADENYRDYHDMADNCHLPEDEPNDNGPDSGPYLGPIGL
jgi:hypothetical protein